MIWNTELQRLEFDDGSPVGALSLNAALAARGEEPKQAHLLVHPKCEERSKATYAMGRKTVKKLLKLGNDGIARATGSRNYITPRLGTSASYNAQYLLPGLYGGGDTEE